MSVEYPVQIITAGEEEGTPNYDEFTLKKEALRVFWTRFNGMLVSVVSVVGAFRTGKSFLLTLFLRYPTACGGDGVQDMIKDDRWLCGWGGDCGKKSQSAFGAKEDESGTEEKDKKNGRVKTRNFAWRGVRTE